MTKVNCKSSCKWSIDNICTKEEIELFCLECDDYINNDNILENKDGD